MDQLERLKELSNQRNTIDNQITATVHAAREQGATWASIGEALNISRQATQQKYGAPPQGEAS